MRYEGNNKLGEEMEKLVYLIARIAAYVIDYLLFWGLLLLLGRYGVAGYSVSLLLFFAYRYVSTAVTGKTIGLLLLGLSLEGFGWRSCFQRELLRFASAYYYIGYGLALVDGHGRTLHDLLSKTQVRFQLKRADGHNINGRTMFSKQREMTPSSGSKDLEHELPALHNENDNIGKSKLTDKNSFVQKWLERLSKPVVALLLCLSIPRWLAGFVLDDLGGVGLSKVMESRQYHQSFDGDNLLSLSQNELYLQTLGRRYTAVVELNHKPALLRLANKRDHSEIYLLDLHKQPISGKLLYQVPFSIQFLCSGHFRSEKELCGITPLGRVVLLDQKGQIAAEIDAKTRNIIMVKCGDLDLDGRDELVLLGRSGDLEIIDYDDANNQLHALFVGKPGDDISISAFFICDGVLWTLAQNNMGRSLIGYRCNLLQNPLFQTYAEYSAKQITVGQLEKIAAGVLLSNVNRNGMTFGVGKLQTLELYRLDHTTLVRQANFGSRPARGYAFKVRTLEEIVDLDGDGNQEMILKAVDKADVMGQDYVLEFYRLDNTRLKLNHFLSKLQQVIP